MSVVLENYKNTLNKILILDDETIITSTLKTLLEFEGNYDVITFNSPIKALDYLKENPVGLIISDFLMPDMNGIDFFIEVKKQYPSITLILLTGYADKENAIKAINEVGIYKYLEKPWNNDDLMLAVQNGLERNQLKAEIKAQKELERLRDDFIATLTHDLRTPLLASIQMLKFFNDGTLGEVSEEQKKFLETMLTSNQEMLGLVNALLEVYKYESGKLNLYKEKFDFSSLLDDCYNQLFSLSEKKNIELIKKYENSIIIEADKQEIRRVIMNLIGNAIVHNSENRQIEIMCEPQANNLVFKVKDNGQGIPEEDLKILFNRFSQGTSKKRSSGTGLGLYLSRQIIEAHGGKIYAESEINVGSTFAFELENCVVSQANLVNK